MRKAMESAERIGILPYLERQTVNLKHVLAKAKGARQNSWKEKREESRLVQRANKGSREAPPTVLV